MASTYAQKTEMEQSFYDVITKIWSKTESILSSGYGWLTGVVTAILTFFLPIKLMLIVISVLVFTDLTLGVWINRKNILSSKLRDTVIKFAFYIITIGGVYAIEFAIGVGVLYKAVFALAGLVEIYSIAANFLVISPNTPFLRLFKKILEKEIGKKVDLSGKKVGDMLDDGQENNSNK